MAHIAFATIGCRTKEELVDKVADIYLGYWQVNQEVDLKGLGLINNLMYAIILL